MRANQSLGRSVLVRPDQATPAGWEGCERVGADDLDRLELGWQQRQPLVIESEDEPGVDEVETCPVWQLTPQFALRGERLLFALHANAVDMRQGGQGTWDLSELAVRLGARPGGLADVVLSDGTAAWLDGGPLRWAGPDRTGAVTLHRLGLQAGSLVPFGPNWSEAQLAPDQLEAVLHPGGAARIIAPAGSGKTRVLVERARTLLRGWGVPARALCLVAYNKKAADEMLARTTDMPALQIRTLNALGLSILGRAGRPTQTIEERDVRQILDGLVDLPRRANQDPAAAWIEALSAVRLGLVDPARVQAEFGGDTDGLPEVLVRYRQELAAKRVVDYDEQVYQAIEVLLANPQLRRDVRLGCQMLLVDEFQDLTPAHLVLIRLLAGPAGQVYGVGDDDQTIYSYAGASPRWLIDYNQSFPTAQSHPLRVNYRCPRPIVRAAVNLLSYNRQRVPKEIDSPSGMPEPPVGQGLVVLRAGDDPLGATCEQVALLTGQHPASQVAVLCRVNASLAPVQVALVHRGVPVRPAVDVSYLQRGGVQAALAWLRLAVAQDGGLAGRDLMLAARRPSRSMSPRLVSWIGERNDLNGLLRMVDRMQDRDRGKLEEYISDVQAVRRAAAGGNTVDVLRLVRDSIGLDKAMLLLEGSRRRLDRSAQTDDLDALVALAGLHPDPGGFESWLAQSLSDPGTPDGVVLSTVHRVKGQEWPFVVLHDVSEGLLPHRLASDVEEERRVFHVGLTRAINTSWVVAGSRPSRFVDELGRMCPPGYQPQQSVTPVRESSQRAVFGPAGRGGHGPMPNTDVAARLAAFAQGTQLAVPDATTERIKQALRSWRTQQATKSGKPPYIYLYDRTIEQMAQQAPETMAQLARIDGIGPAKLESYGEQLLEIIGQAASS